MTSEQPQDHSRLPTSAPEAVQRSPEPSLNTNGKRGRSEADAQLVGEGDVGTDEDARERRVELDREAVGVEEENQKLEARLKQVRCPPSRFYGAMC
jgi:hypothetical protein